MYFVHKVAETCLLSRSWTLGLVFFGLGLELCAFTNIASGFEVQDISIENSVPCQFVSSLCHRFVAHSIDNVMFGCFRSASYFRPVTFSLMFIVLLCLSLVTPPITARCQYSSVEIYNCYSEMPRADAL